ncbi:MAG: lysoplasmalogenase family protein [Erysipelotrichaceae bacterium]
MYLLCGLYAFSLKEKSFPLIILMTAFFFSYLGDVVLLWSFKKGGYAFMTGNVIYCIYLFIIHYQYHLWQLWVVVIMITLLYALYRYFVKSGILDLGGMEAFNYYMISVISQGSMGAVMALFTSVDVYRVLSIGLLLFMISDFFISFQNFYSKESKLIKRCNSITYFSGMMLIAIYIGL